MYKRFLFLAAFFCLSFGAAVARLIELQFYRSDELVAYRENRLRHTEQKAPRRGRILDADGKILAEDQPTQDLWVVPARRERSSGRIEIASNLEPLNSDQILSLAAGSSVLEMNLAVRTLAESNGMVKTLSERLGIDRETIAERILHGVLSGRPTVRDDLLAPRPALEDLDFGLALEIRASLANPYSDGKWRGAEMRMGGKRRYPAGKILGHITGYVGKLSPEDYLALRGQWDAGEKAPGSGEIIKQGRVFFSVKSDDPDNPTDEDLIIRLREVKRNGRLHRSQGYLRNETVGRGGIEQQYNQALRGRHIIQRLRLARNPESRRRHFEPLDGVERARNGADVRLSLRLDIQKKAHEIMEKAIAETARDPELIRSGWIPSGVAIMMDPRNGRIHALVSIPSYDPNTLSLDFVELLKDPGLPLLDRATAGIYPPGSVVKPLVGLAALSEDKVMPGQRFFCDRVMHLGGARFTCLGRHGDQDLEAALMNSCNIYFFRAGEALGSHNLYNWYTRTGVGRKTGIDLPGEGDGILPRNAYTRRGWATGNTYHLSIGQGLAVTPLQIAILYSVLANAQGNVARVVRPHFLIPPARHPETPEEEALELEAIGLDLPIAEIGVDMGSLAFVREGMWRAIQGDPEHDYRGGTGQRAAFTTSYPGAYLLEWAGKTGTAEWSRVVNGRVVKGVDHVWFAGYAPFDRPELVVVVMLPEAGGGGGWRCAPIAKELVRMWFNVPEEERGALG
ncbi:MAG: hypothetical protein LBJ46_02525 [Planctomycetota bacterium]|jgi:cell division protein FtsI/penicillin-binding protein 2|nr:hypothetical protein [Planctomycetota bacterium]